MLEHFLILTSPISYIVLLSIPIESLSYSVKRLGSTKMSTTESVMEGGQDFWNQGSGQHYL